MLRVVMCQETIFGRVRVLAQINWTLELIVRVAFLFLGLLLKTTFNSEF